MLLKHPRLEANAPPASVSEFLQRLLSLLIRDWLWTVQSPTSSVYSPRPEAGAQQPRRGAGATGADADAAGAGTAHEQSSCRRRRSPREGRRLRGVRS